MSQGKGRAIAMALAALLGASGVVGQDAESSGVGLGDLVTLNVYAGDYSPASRLEPGAGFRSSGSVGGAATVWVTRNVGVRANLLYARTESSPGSPGPLAGERPEVWTYSGDVVARLPVVTGDGRDYMIPYGVVGVGGKTYLFGELDTATDLAGTIGAGVEYRFSRWGLQAEVRDVVSKFDRYGLSRTQHDIVWTGGVTLSL